MTKLPETRRSSTGGRIVYTKTGLIHYNGTRYSGDYDEKNASPGRPERDKIKVTTDIKFDIRG